MRYEVTYFITEYGKLTKKITFVEGPELHRDESNVKEVEEEIDKIMYQNFGRNIKVMSMKPLY